MAMTPTYVQYLLTQHDLLSRILAFNYDFKAKQNALRAQKPLEEVQDSLFKLHPELAKFHAEHNISYCFEKSVDRLCLIRQSELERLVIFLGACISAPQLARIQKQTELDTVYEQIGRQVYNFALDYGYLIKSFDYEPNLDSLRDDCSYLGLCALKCLQTLFSSIELKEYFIDLLIAYTKSHKLDPNIITSETHLLTVVASPVESMRPPAPTVMNNPVQLTPIDAHPSLDPHPNVQEVIPEDNAKDNQAQAHEHANQVQKHHRLHNGSGDNLNLSGVGGKHINQIYAPYAEIPTTPGPIVAGSLDSVTTVTDAKDAADNKNTQTETAQANAAQEQAQDAQSEQNTQTNQTSQEAQGQGQGQSEQQAQQQQQQPQQNNDDLPEGVGAPMPITYESAALYSTMNSEAKRHFRTISLRQQNTHQELLQPKKEPQNLEQDKLVTLEFNPQQVFYLSRVILQSQIDEHWYEYLL